MMEPKFLHGDALNKLDDITFNSIQTTITSPPYFHLRNYFAGSSDEIGREETLGQYVSNLADIFEKLFPSFVWFFPAVRIALIFQICQFADSG